MKVAIFPSIPDFQSSIWKIVWGFILIKFYVIWKLHTGSDSKPELEWFLPAADEKHKKTRSYSTVHRSGFLKIYFPADDIICWKPSLTKRQKLVFMQLEIDETIDHLVPIYSLPRNFPEGRCLRDIGNNRKIFRGPFAFLNHANVNSVLVTGKWFMSIEIFQKENNY